MPISTDELRRLLKKEGSKVDLKLTLPLKTKDDKAKFVKHVIALANTPRGTGYLLIGVDDKTKQPKEAPPPEGIEEDVQRILSTYCQPLIETEYEIVKIKGVSVGALSIYRKSVDLPYRVKKTVGGDKNLIEVDDIFIRHGRLSERPTYQELEALILEGNRAREKAKRGKPLEPSKDDYTYMSVQSRLLQMRKDLLREMRRLGLKPIPSGRKRDLERWPLPRSYGLANYNFFLASNVRLAQVTEHKTTGLIIFYIFPDNFCRDEYRLINEEDIVPVARKQDIDKYGQARRQLPNHGFRLTVALVYGAIYKSAFPQSYYYEVTPLPQGYHLKPVHERELHWETNHKLYLKQIHSKENLAKALGWVREWISDHISELTKARGKT